MLENLIERFRPGAEIFLPSGPVEIGALNRAFEDHPACLEGVRFTACLIPGLNSFDPTAVNPSARLRLFLLPPALQSAFEAGRVEVMPIGYSAIARHLITRAPFDLAIAHVTAPDEQGLVSLSIGADFSALAWKNAKARIAVINRALPRVARSVTLDLDEADLVVEIDEPVRPFVDAAPSESVLKIARLAAERVPDGAAVQMGIGGAPGAMWQALSGHRELVIASGLVSEGLRGLDEAGALAHGADHATGIALGSRDFHDWLARRDLVRFAGADETHDVRALAQRPNFTALNSALEIDLYGQINLEWPGARLASGVGGAADFARASQLSSGGQAFVLLPAAAKGATVSRIVPKITAPTVSMPRSEIDWVVTEEGAVRVREMDMQERARALISIAHPDFREGLERAWSAITR